MGRKELRSLHLASHPEDQLPRVKMIFGPSSSVCVHDPCSFHRPPALDLSFFLVTSCLGQKWPVKAALTEYACELQVFVMSAYPKKGRLRRKLFLIQSYITRNSWEYSGSPMLFVSSLRRLFVGCLGPGHGRRWCNENYYLRSTRE